MTRKRSLLNDERALSDSLSDVGIDIGSRIEQSKVTENVDFGNKDGSASMRCTVFKETAAAPDGGFATHSVCYVTW